MRTFANLGTLFVLVGAVALVFRGARAVPTLTPDANKPIEQSDPLKPAVEVLAANRIKTLEFVASGSSFTVGQNFAPNDLWPKVPVKTYTALINYESEGMRIDMLREMGTTMPRGGGVPFTGGLRQIQVVSGDYAWNQLSSISHPEGAAPATPCTLPEAGGTSWAGPAQESHLLCRLALWATPQGFVKAALAGQATTKEVAGGTEVSFTIAGKYKMAGLINAQHQVARVRTWVEQSIVGDMLVETEYSGYKDFGGVQFPSHIVQKQDGFPSLDLIVASVTVNPGADIAVPPDVRNAPPPPIGKVTAKELAPGVFWLTGWSHHSLAVAMKDHIVLVDTPNGEERAEAVITKTKQLIPNKPIRYVVAMHHHWDHMGGIRSAIAEGATIITQEKNKALLERAAEAPRTIDPDRLSKQPKPLKMETVGTEKMLSDGTRVIELYAMSGFEHTADLLLVYLPKENILAEADAYTPPDLPSTPIITPKVPYAVALYDNIQRLKLNVQLIAPFHGARTVDVAEIKRQAGL